MKIILYICWKMKIDARETTIDTNEGNCYKYVYLYI